MGRGGHRGARSLAAYVVALTGFLLALAGPSQAAASVSYVNNAAPLGANSADDSLASCPSGQVVGGSGFITGNDLEIEISSSVPFDSKDNDQKPDDGWEAQGNNGPSPQTLTAWAICSNDGPFRYVHTSKRLDAFSARLIRTSCPDGYRVLGGGTGVDAGGTTVTMLGSVGRGVGTQSRTDDGWKGTIVNDSAGSPKMTTWAICAQGVKTSGQFIYNGAPIFLNNTQDSMTTGDCPDGYVITGGGGIVVGGPIGTEVASLRPVDTDAGDPDNAWQTYFNNESGAAQKMSVHSVCAKL